MPTILVTGGGRGIGRAIALAFAEPGSRVAIAARTRTQLEETAVAIRDRGAEALLPDGRSRRVGSRGRVRRTARDLRADRRAREQRRPWRRDASAQGRH